MLVKNFFSVLNPIFQNSMIPIFQFLSIIPFFQYSSFYLNFNVPMATNPRIMAMIQNRTMIFGSAQPFNSKW